MKHIPNPLRPSPHLYEPSSHSSQSCRFFQVWLPSRLPYRANHPIYFGVAKFYLSPRVGHVRLLGRSAETLPLSLPDLWSRADADGKLLPAWARLGPLSASHSLRNSSHRRLPRFFARGRSPKWGGEAVSRLDGRGISRFDRASHSRHALASCTRHDLPDPVPRIAYPLRPFLAILRHAGSDAPLIGGLSPPGRRMRGLLAKVRAPIWCITRGDSNPTCLTDTFASISSGWPRQSFRICPEITLRSLAAGFRPARV